MASNGFTSMYYLAPSHSCYPPLLLEYKLKRLPWTAGTLEETTMWLQQTSKMCFSIEMNLYCTKIVMIMIHFVFIHIKMQLHMLKPTTRTTLPHIPHHLPRSGPPASFPVTCRQITELTESGLRGSPAPRENQPIRHILPQSQTGAAAPPHHQHKPAEGLCMWRFISFFFFLIEQKTQVFDNPSKQMVSFVFRVLVHSIALPSDTWPSGFC